MWSIKELKAKGKAAFRANYWRSVLVSLILVALLGGNAYVVSRVSSEQAPDTTETTDFSEILEDEPPEVILTIVAIGLVVGAVVSLVTTLVSALIFNPLKVGCQRFFLVNSDAPADFPELGFGYTSNYLNMVKTLLLKDIFLFLWALLFVIPAVVKSYSYRMTPYILAENPSIGSKEAISLSRQMMNGHKWNAFMLDLSFIGWCLLTAVTLGLAGVFYASPYYFATDAELYKAVRDLYKPETL